VSLQILPRTTSRPRSPGVGAAEVWRDLALPAGGIEGTVVDAETGEPVGGATVWARPEGAAGPAGAEGDRELGGGETDDEGRFTIRHLAPGRFSLRIVPRAHADARVDGIDVGRGMTGVKAPVERGTDIRIEVVDGAGRPVPAVRAVFRDPLGDETFLGPDGPPGAIEIRYAPAGSYDVLVAGRGHAPARVRFAVPPRAEPRAALGAGGTLVVAVADAAGRPVARAEISALDEGAY